MKALLLSAGFGKRLLPITKNTPKCLVKIKNKPLLSIWLEKLNECSINNILINTHYLSEQVNDFVKHSLFRDKIDIVFEKNLLGSGGTLITNLDYFLGEDCIMIHADNYSLQNLDEFIDAHNKKAKIL